MRSSFPILYVDVAASLGFSRDLLGFQQLYRFPPHGDPGWGSLGLGVGKLGLSDAGFQAPHGQPQRPITGGPSAVPGNGRRG